MSLSPRDRARLCDVTTGVTVCALLVLTARLHGSETLPYHLLFLLLTIVYGFRVWPLVPTLLVLSAVTAATGVIFYRAWETGVIESAELIEVPLMPALMLAMVWHARRRAAAQEANRQMARALERSIERERAFLSDASHAIRTPVTIARCHVELLTPTLAGIAHEDAQVVLRQLSRMDQLAGRLLALARLESGDAVHLRRMDVGQLVRTVGSDWSAFDRIWTIDGGHDHFVLGDAEWLRIALDALIENALKFTDPHDRIEITCEVHDRLVAISVSDSGPGVSERDRALVFDRFWHRSINGRPTGSGLGLATVRAVAVTHGGHVTVGESTWGGAKFCLMMPLTQSPLGAFDPPSLDKESAATPTAT